MYISEKRLMEERDPYLDWKDNFRVYTYRGITGGMLNRRIIIKFIWFMP